MENKFETKPNNNAFASTESDGLTKREYFAAQILGGLCGSTRGLGPNEVKACVKLADMLIAELNSKWPN